MTSKTYARFIGNDDDVPPSSEGYLHDVDWNNSRFEVLGYLEEETADGFGVVIRIPAVGLAIVNSIDFDYE